MLASDVGSIKVCRQFSMKMALSVKSKWFDKYGFCALTVDVYGLLLENIKLVLFTPVVLEKNEATCP